MNIGALLVLAKLAEVVGFTVSPKANGPTPPTADVGARPSDSSCPVGEKIIFNENPDRYVCVPRFD